MPFNSEFGQGRRTPQKAGTPVKQIINTKIIPVANVIFMKLSFRIPDLGFHKMSSQHKATAEIVFILFLNGCFNHNRS